MVNVGKYTIHWSYGGSSLMKFCFWFSWKPGTGQVYIISPFSELFVLYVRPNFELKVNDCMSKGSSVQKFRLYMEYIPIFQGWFLLLFSLNNVMIRILYKIYCQALNLEPRMDLEQNQDVQDSLFKTSWKGTPCRCWTGKHFQFVLLLSYPALLAMDPRDRIKGSHIAAEYVMTDDYWIHTIQSPNKCIYMKYSPGIQLLVCFEHLIYKSDAMMLMLLPPVFESYSLIIC